MTEEKIKTRFEFAEHYIDLEGTRDQMESLFESLNLVQKLTKFDAKQYAENFLEILLDKNFYKLKVFEGVKLLGTSLRPIKPEELH